MIELKWSKPNGGSSRGVQRQDWVFNLGLEEKFLPPQDSCNELWAQDLVTLPLCHSRHSWGFTMTLTGGGRTNKRKTPNFLVLLLGFKELQVIWVRKVFRLSRELVQFSGVFLWISLIIIRKLEKLQNRIVFSAICHINFNYRSRSAEQFALTDNSFGSATPNINWNFVHPSINHTALVK